MDRRMFVLLVYFSFSTLLTAEAHLIDGIFTEPTLDPGYHLVATIPAGASNLNVSELRHTNNYLAVRLQDGEYLFNGNYSINWSGVYKGAGTSFIYHRQTAQQLESFTAIGPLQEPIDVMLLYQEPNSGIVYRYLAPGGMKDRPGRGQAKNHLRMIGDETPAPPLKRYRKRKFAWRSHGFTACSKTCGGGIQTRTYVCVREHSQGQVPMKRCHGLDKPLGVQTRCNVGPCPPKWRIGTWTKCSVTCGTGIRTRSYECVQEVNNLLTVRVADGACMDSKSPSNNETCIMPACENDSKYIDSSRISNVTPRWDIGEWSPCSTSCGIGKRTRSITCITRDRSCPVAEMPANEESCNLADCSILRRSNSILDSRKSRWLHTEWSKQCSSDCGTGFETRKVICVNDESSEYVDGIIKKNEGNDGEKCEKDTRPESTRTCSSNKTCSGQWFTGPWTQCSTSCDEGEQTREAICVTTLQGSLRMVLDMNCPAAKPETRKSCRGPPCQSIWYTSDWTECSRSCGSGIQSREVKCINPTSHTVELAHNCNEIERPESGIICNNYPCRSTVELRDGEGSTRLRNIQNDPEVTSGVSGDDHCKDSTANCSLVIQARLCIYPFYRKICCVSCSKSKWEEME